MKQSSPLDVSSGWRNLGSLESSGGHLSYKVRKCLCHCRYNRHVAEPFKRHMVHVTMKAHTCAESSLHRRSQAAATQAIMQELQHAEIAHLSIEARSSNHRNRTLWLLLTVVKIQSFWRRRYDTATERRTIERKSLPERFRPSGGRHRLESSLEFRGREDAL
jgi:hypothetical protein